MPTNNHDLNTPSKGTQDWGAPINENTQKLDTLVEIRDNDANKSNYDPKNGALFRATDTGSIYRGNGSSWVKMDASVQHLDVQKGTVNDASVNTWQEVPLQILTSEDNVALGLQFSADGANDNETSGGYAATVQYYNASGERVATTSADAHNHWGVYTKTDSFGSGNTQPRKRFQIEGGSEVAAISIQNNKYTHIENPSGTARLILRSATDDSWMDVHSAQSGNRAGLRMLDANANTKWRFEYDDSVSKLRLANPTAGGPAFAVSESDNTIDFKENEVKNVVWDSGSSRPSSPETGQRFFDTSLGQPIWYDGSNWVDASGNAV